MVLRGNNMAGDDKNQLLKICIYVALFTSFLVSLPGAHAAENPRIEGQGLPSVDNISIPTCINITLQAEEYVLGQNGNLHIKGDANITFSTENVTFSLNNSAQICYPLFPTFHECLKKLVMASQYEVDENKILIETASGRMHHLGNYYITSESLALTCYKGRTCNYITFQQDEYNFRADGSLWLKPVNETLNNAKYTIEPTTMMANVCYPLTQEFVSCTKWLLEHNEFTITPEKMLYSKAHDEFYGAGDYVLLYNRRAVACINLVPDNPTFDVYVLHAAVHVISAICLAVAILLHIIIPDLSYQRAPLLCHAFSLMITYICLAARKFNAEIDTVGCYTVFYLTYFFCLAAFCWLSVLAFDIWRITAHLLKGTDGYSWVNSFRNKKMILYSIFGWGVPLIFIVVVSIVDCHDHVQDLLKLYPRIANMCWFSEKPSTYVFLFGPMCLLLVVNFVFFALSVHNIYKSSRNNAEFTNTKLNKQLLVICFIVFLAMGLFWVMEVVQYGTFGGSMEWIVPDLINASQGIIIAAVYTCRPLTCRRLREKASKRNVGKH